MAKPIEVTDEDFDQEVLKADLPVLVDFWAEWCAPCKTIGPMLEELAEEYDGRVKFVKLDTEENFDIPGRYGIRGLPTLLVFKGGQKVDQILGARPKAEMKRLLEKVIAGDQHHMVG